MRILLVSTYEMGHQPLGLAAPAAALRAAGHEVRCLDLAVTPPDPDAIREAELIAVSAPMHTAARLGTEFARRARALNPDAKVAFFGLYATPLYDLLVPSGIADSVVGGEYEPGLVALAGGGKAGIGRTPAFERQLFPIPDRSGLPPLTEYARLNVGDELRLAGYVEASRGCAHVCQHCPLTPVYGGRLRLVQPETVLADIDQLADLGAEHITFGDPDFLNAVPHSLAIVAEMRRRHPRLTFDATIKVEHLVEHESLLPRLRELGCLFITSAFESTNDDVLKILGKGHTLADMERVVQASRREGIALRPTWVAFTPWTALEDFLDLLAFVEEHGLVNSVQPVQYALRLLLPPGSPLIETLEAAGRLGPFDDERLTYTWESEDPRVDALQRELALIVERSVTGECRTCAGEPYEATFARVKRAALRAFTGIDREVAVAQQPRKPVPGLTESWFC